MGTSSPQSHCPAQILAGIEACTRHLADLKKIAPQLQNNHLRTCLASARDRDDGSAIKLADQKVVCANGRTYLRRSTISWQLCCQWKDDSTSWTNLTDLKESHPIEVAEYAKIIGIDHEPAFNWWSVILLFFILHFCYAILVCYILHSSSAILVCYRTHCCSAILVC